MKSDFAWWLERQYVTWQRNEGERKTLAAFADWLGVAPSTVSHWMNGVRKPCEAHVGLLAQKLGRQVYAVLDRPRLNG